MPFTCMEFSFEHGWLLLLSNFMLGRCVSNSLLNILGYQRVQDVEIDVNDPLFILCCKALW